MRGSVTPFNGSASSPAMRMLAGDNVVTTDGAGRGVVAFVRPFAVAPIVVAMGGNGESITQVEPAATSSATGFAFYAYTQAGVVLANSAVRVRWHAIGV